MLKREQLRPFLKPPSGIKRGRRKESIKASTQYTERTSENFRAAYDAVNRTKDANDYVKVSDMRDELGWSKKEVDGMIADLRKRGAIQMNIGDPHLMTKREYENGYADDFARHFDMMYGSLTWLAR